MKRFIQTLKNIWSIEDLRKRILYTIGLVLVYRIGCYVALPGVDPTQLQNLQNQGSDGLMGLLNMFSGGAFSNASIFALGIMPYITASIVIQLFVMVIPSFQKMQRDGENGRRKMNQITRLLTVAITGFQAPAYITNMMYQLGASSTAIYPFDGTSPTWTFWASSIIILIAGTLFVMWLGERITEKGVGNGISLLIMIGIIARLPFALFGEFVSRLTDAGGGLVSAGRSDSEHGSAVGQDGVPAVSLQVSAVDAASFADFLDRGGLDKIKQALFEDNRRFASSVGVW